MGPANVHLISSANKRVHRVSICALYRVCRESRYVAQRREILELRIGKKTICPALANPDDVFVITRLPAAPRRFVYSAVMDICISRGLLKKDRHTHRIGMFGAQQIRPPSGSWKGKIGVEAHPADQSPQDHGTLPSTLPNARQ